MADVKTQIAQYAVNNLEAELFPNPTMISLHENLQQHESKYQSGLMRAAEKYLKLGSLIDRVTKRVVTLGDMETFAGYKSGLHNEISSEQALDFLMFDFLTSGGQGGVHFGRGLDYITLVSENDPSDRRIVKMADVEYDPATWSKIAAGAGIAFVAGVGGFVAAAHGNSAYSSHPQQTDSPAVIPICKNPINATDGKMSAGEWDNGKDFYYTKAASTGNSEVNMCYIGDTLYFLVKDFRNSENFVYVDKSGKVADVRQGLNLFGDPENNGGTSPKKDDFVICYEYRSGSHIWNGERFNALTRGNDGAWIDVENGRLYDHEIKMNNWGLGYHHAQDATDKNYTFWEGSYKLYGDKALNLPALISPDNTSGIFGIKFDVYIADNNCKKRCLIYEESSPTDKVDRPATDNIPNEFLKAQLQQPPVVTTTTTSSTSQTVTTVTCSCPETTTTSVTTSMTATAQNPTVTPIPEHQNSLIALVSALFVTIFGANKIRKRKNQRAGNE